MEFSAISYIRLEIKIMASKHTNREGLFL